MVVQASCLLIIQGGTRCPSHKIGSFFCEVLLSNLFGILNARQNLDSQDRELIMQLSPLYLERIQDATKQGIQQGIQQGIEREAVSFVMRLLNRRFGLIAPDIEKQIRSLSVERIEDLGEALLDFQSEADLTTWIDNIRRDNS